MRPAQIISLMDLGPPTFILPDHYNHIHVGYTLHDRAAARSSSSARSSSPSSGSA